MNKKTFFLLTAVFLGLSAIAAENKAQLPADLPNMSDIQNTLVLDVETLRARANTQEQIDKSLAQTQANYAYAGPLLPKLKKPHPLSFFGQRMLFLSSQGAGEDEWIRFYEDLYIQLKKQPTNKKD